MRDSKNVYDDGNIPEVDLPQHEFQVKPIRSDFGESTYNESDSDRSDSNGSVEPLPESTRPRKDGPGGN